MKSRWLIALLLSHILVGCGAGPDAADSGSGTPMKTPLAVSSTSTAGVVIQVYQALYGKAPGYADYSSYLAQASTSNQVFANALVAKFASSSDKALALLVLNNLGITATTVTQTGSYAALLSAVEQIFAAYGSAARGQILLNMTTLLAGLSSDVTFGVAATTYSSQVQANASYSATSTNTSSSVVAVVTVPGAPTIGAATIGAATAGDAQASVAFTAPSSTGGASISAYTVSCVSASSSKTGTGSSSPVTVSSLSNASAYSCSVTATNSAGTGSASGTVAVTPSAATSLTVTPQPFNQVITASYQPTTLASVSSSGFTSRNRYLISDSATGQTSANFLSIGSSNSNGYGATTVSFSSAANPTMKTYLASLIHVVTESDGYFRLDSHLHSNQSIDYSSTNGNILLFENNFSYTSSANLGYITFSYDSSTNLIQAKNRYTYSTPSSTVQTSTTKSYTGYTPTHIIAASFPAKNYYISLNSGVYSLVESFSAASKFYLYTPPIDFGIPANFNPQPISYTSAAAVPGLYALSVPSVFESTSSTESPYSFVSSTYRPQVASSGNNASTKIAAATMLSSIAAAATTNNFSLRYSTEIYASFRDAMLSNTQISDSLFDGITGHWSVPYVYFTNEKDTSGSYHPMMVIYTYTNLPYPNNLLDVPSPPGQATTTATNLKDQNVTRYANMGVLALAIPMKDYGLVSDVSTNSYASNSFTEANITISSLTTTAYNYHGTADIGVLVNGISFYSTMTGTINGLPFPSTWRGELSVNGCHVGQGGGGPHCHADGYQSGPAAGHNVYSDADYLGATHPPLIGFGKDGVALFAQYRSSDTNLLGYSTSLEPFGGHNHDGIGYHYHAHTVKNYSVTGNGKTDTFDIPVLMRGAYIGNINSVPYFDTNLATSKQSIYMGATASTR